MGKKLPKSINLLETIHAPGDTFTIFYEWTFKVGKYLLIFVQIIVILVFVMRLTVDKINNDLTRDINNQVEFLLQAGVEEKEIKYRTFQAFFNDLDHLDETQEKNARRVVSVLDNIPENITLENYSFNNNVVSTSFVANNLGDVRSYESFLKQSPEYTNVTVNLEKTDAEDSGIEFRVQYNIVTGREEEL